MSEPSPPRTPDDAKPSPEPQAVERATSSRVGDGRPKDASRFEIFLYAFGNIEGAIANQFFTVLNQVMIVAMQVNPLLIGLLGSVKTLVDGVIDPVIAHITDNTRSRFGRRIPYIFVAGITRVLLLIAIVAFLPSGGKLTPNAVMEAQKHVNEGVQQIAKTYESSLKAREQLPTAEAADRAELLTALASIPEQNAKASTKINDHLPVIENDDLTRASELARRQARLAEGKASNTTEKEIRDLSGSVTAAQDALDVSQKLLKKARDARRDVIVANHLSGHLLAVYGGTTADPSLADAAVAQTLADAAFAEAGLAPVNLLTAARPPPPKPGERPHLIQGITDGFTAFFDPRNIEQRGLIIYVLFALLIMTVVRSFQSVPYFALGMEIAPSYDGRTRVVIYRAVTEKVANLAAPWVPVFCFAPFFLNATDGLFWTAIAASLIGIPTTVWMCLKVKERNPVKNSNKEHPSLLGSIVQVTKNRQFLQIFALYMIVGFSNGLFTQVGFFLNVYWVMGSPFSGAIIGAQVAMIAMVLGIISLPAINWACRKFQKHLVLQAAIIWMAIGAASKWWAYNPEHPEFQFILPFFWSIGISSIYTLLPSLMADVTDLDDLNHGFRREGMFAAVMSFLMQFVGTIIPVLAGAVLVIAGFDPALEYRQEPMTILNMRLMLSFIPAVMLITGVFVLWRYPLTRHRVEEIKAELQRRNNLGSPPHEPGAATH